MGVGGDFLSGGIEDVGGEGHLFTFADTGHLSGDFYCGVILGHVGSDEISSPHRDMDPVAVDEMHVAVKAGTGIPAGRLRFVFERHFDDVLAGTSGPAEVGLETVVAIGPESHLFSVDLDAGVAHGAVEKERLRAPCGVGKLEDGAVIAFAYVGKATGAACFPGLFSLAVLLHCNFLKVVAAVEGTVDGPVVRNAYAIPGDGIFAEVPRFEKGVGARCADGRNEGERERCRYEFIHYLSFSFQRCPGQRNCGIQFVKLTKFS